MIASSIWGEWSQLQAVIPVPVQWKNLTALALFFLSEELKICSLKDRYWFKMGEGRSRDLGPMWRARWQISRVFSGTGIQREYWVLKIVVICPTTNYLSGLVTAAFGRAFHLISNKRLQSSVPSHLLVAHWPRKGPWGQHGTCLGKGEEKYWVAFWGAKGKLSVHISLDCLA